MRLSQKIDRIASRKRQKQKVTVRELFEVANEVRDLEKKINTLEIKIKDREDTWFFWEHRHKEEKEKAEYYQDELEKAHTLLGRIIQQVGERWDSVNLTKHFPTNNLHGKKTINNPKGE